jgi:hypothetical protein
MEAPMSNDPLSEADSPGRGDVDQSTWNKGVIVAAILAAFVIGVIVWFATNTPHTANNLPPPTTGQGSNRPPVAKYRGTGTRINGVVL